ncbi:hypothetical protein ISCGN_008730 [Ixodes scapularis]
MQLCASLRKLRDARLCATGSMLRGGRPAREHELTLRFPDVGTVVRVCVSCGVRLRSCGVAVARSLRHLRRQSACFPLFGLCGSSLTPSTVFSTIALPMGYNNYTAKLKLLVIKFAEENGNRTATRQFKVSESHLRYWRRQKSQLASARPGRKEFSGAETEGTFLLLKMNCYSIFVITGRLVTLCHARCYSFRQERLHKKKVSRLQRSRLAEDG